MSKRRPPSVVEKLSPQWSSLPVRAPILLVTQPDGGQQERKIKGIAKMPSTKKTRRGVIGAVVLAGVLAAGGYALTDAVGVPSTSHAGDGQSAVETLTATAVHYGLNASNPANVDSVAFTLDHAVAAGGSAFVQPDGTNWYACDTSGGTAITCNTTVGTQLTAANVTQVRVVAAD
jgi:hypothetical protein